MTVPDATNFASPEGEAAVRRLREAQVLGRGNLLTRLFDHLVDCAAQGRVPKEAEIAVDAFGRGADFDGSQDASVRVYAHRLRKALDDYYAGPGRSEPVRLSMPRGEYRLVAARWGPEAEVPGPEPAPAAAVVLPAPPSEPWPETPPQPQPTVAPPVAAPARRAWLRQGAALAAAAAVGAGVAFALARRRTPAEQELAQVRASPLWAPLLDDERPLVVVTGDYLLLGDTEGGLRVQRLVREFDIDTSEDLARHERRGRYADIGLSYLPVAAGSALRDVLPLLALPHKRIRVLPASQTSADGLGLAHIVYVGLLSGLGRLRSLVFAGSGLAIGSSYDELVDTGPGGRRYVAQGREARGELRDYSFIATLSGPGGNRIVVAAGTRDLGLAQAGRIVGRAEPLAQLQAAVAGAEAFEALYQTVASSPDGPHTPERLLARPLKAARTWQPAR